VHDFGAGHFPGEFVFVPRAEQGSETDGWYMGLVINAAEETTDLVLLDAADFTGAPVATIRLPHRIPPGFHGNWVAD
jgi:carotenoid cleavage dioxygenase